MTATGPELAGSFGMAASTHWLATASAMSVLERGGNAFDAAVSAGFVLQVVQPHLDGPGGEAPAILWSEAGQSLQVLNGQGVAPQAASIAAFADLGLSEVPGTGLLPATVPGAFGAWMLLLARYGTWTVRDVLDHAIGYARTGFRAGSSLVAALTSVRQTFATDWPTSHAQWSGQLTAASAGRPVTIPALAATYERVVAAAEAASATRDGQIAAAVRYWYAGPVAERIAAFCAGEPWRDTSGRAHRGLLTAADLQAWQPTFEAPLTFDYGRYTVAKTGPWGQGPVFLQQLALLAGLDLGPHLSAQYVHTVTEAGKLAFADREAWYGDGADPDMLAALLNVGYNDQRRQLVGVDASAELRPGSPLGRPPRLPDMDGPAAGAAHGAMNGAGEPITRTDGRVNGDTCHLDVADRWGNLISVTPSGGWLQSSPTIPELGFCLGTRAQMFWLDEGLPNSLRPGARPRTTLSPSLALRDGDPWLAFGTPGGDQQDQWSLHFFLALTGSGTGTSTGANLRQALDFPMFHSEHFPSSFWPRESRPLCLVVEDSVDADVRAELTRRGHDLTVVPAWTLGRVSAVARERAAGGWHLRAAADVRGGEGYAAGR